MDPHSPNKLIAAKYCFSYLGKIPVSFSFLCYVVYFLLYIFTKIFIIIYLFIFSIKINSIFFHVPGCSGMFRVPGFIDARIVEVYYRGLNLQMHPLFAVGPH